MTALVISGTDTGIGKTVVAAMLTLGLDASYWKPVQSGIADGTDRQTVADLTGLPANRFLPERYTLSQPLSPHYSAELDGVTIDVDALTLPPDTAQPDSRPLIVEGAGGLMVPLTRSARFIDLFQRWQAPVVLCARTALGTINHSLLSIEALQSRNIPLLGIIFVGDAMADSERTICAFGQTKHLGRLPILPTLDRSSLARAFAEHFHREDFHAVLAT